MVSARGHSEFIQEKDVLVIHKRGRHRIPPYQGKGGESEEWGR